MADTDEDEWEDQYVFVELVGMVDPDKLSLCTQENTAILGIDNSEMTVVKLGGYAFAGHYEDSCGSMVLFEETENKANKSLRYRCHTTKMLKASRVFLKPKINSGTIENKDETVEKSKIETDSITTNSSEGTEALPMDTSQEIT